MQSRRKRVFYALIALLFCWLAASAPVRAETPPTQVKEINFVFLHGAGGNTTTLQLLSDSIMDRMPAYSAEYRNARPGMQVQYNTLLRNYPNDVDLDTWARNIAQALNKYYRKDNLVLIGHSMGGKAALYAVSHNIEGIAERVSMVVTINSPVKRLMDYYYAWGENSLEYLGIKWMLDNRGVLDSVAYYDSTEDGSWVGKNKHWLAFISAENAPFSDQFNYSGIEPCPRNMDDVIIPISAQYSQGADVYYYGEYGHSDFATMEDVNGRIADQILNYIFGKPVNCSFFARTGTLEHKANWLPASINWHDLAGELPMYSGQVTHTNQSWAWQEWEDIIGEPPSGVKRGDYTIKKGGLPLLTGIKEVRWLHPDDPSDLRLVVRTHAAPLCSINLDWTIYQQGLLSGEVQRDRYEVEITSATPLTGVEVVKWASEDPLDMRLQIQSRASGPFRWFKVKWSVYFNEPLVRNVIDEMS